MRQGQRGICAAAPVTETNKVDDKRVISSVSRCLNPYEKEGFAQMMEVAAGDDLEIIVSNTTEAGADLYRLVLEVASGKKTKAEGKGFREISIFKDGVVL